MCSVSHNFVAVLILASMKHQPKGITRGGQSQDSESVMKSCETGPKVSCPYPRRLQSLTIC